MSRQFTRRGAREAASGELDGRHRLLPDPRPPERRGRWIVFACAAVGFLGGGLFGFQAVLSEGWATGLWFVLGVGIPGAMLGALVSWLAAALWVRLRTPRG